MCGARTQFCHREPPLELTIGVGVSGRECGLGVEHFASTGG